MSNEPGFEEPPIEIGDDPWPSWSEVIGNFYHPDNPWPKVERMEKALREVLNLAEVGEACTDAKIWPQIVRICKDGLGEGGTTATQPE